MAGRKYRMEHEFKELLLREKLNYMAAFSKRDWSAAALTNDPQYQLWKYHKRMRIAGYYYKKYKESSGVRHLFYLIRYMLARKRRNILGNRLSVDIREQSFGDGLI